jgi:uroporphyrinogen-III synthase
VLLAPAVEIVPPSDPEPLRRALQEAERFDWAVFTSASGVEAVAHQLAEPRRARPWRIAAVGAATASAARAWGWSVDLVPPEYTADALLAALEREAAPLRGKRMLLPLAEGAGSVLPEGLREHGAHVTRVTTYRTVSTPPRVFEDVRRALDAGEVHLLTFTSPSTAASFLESIGSAALQVPVVAIGPVTGEAAREMGYRVVDWPEDHSVAGLIAAVEHFFKGKRGTG